MFLALIEFVNTFKVVLKTMIVPLMNSIADASSDENTARRTSVLDFQSKSSTASINLDMVSSSIGAL
jgi:hypothetical protein